MRWSNPFYFVKVPSWITGWHLSKAVWHGPREKAEIYLTFDDGPTKFTPEILAILNQYNVKASFFCLGKQAEENPEILEAIIYEGHIVGHHTYDHIDGWATTKLNYIESVEKGAAIIKSTFFRPPYGRIQPNTISDIGKKYKVIMWDVMPGDFDATRSDQDVINDTVSKTQNGSIIVLHDKERTVRVLSRILEKLKAKGFHFNTIEHLT